MMDLSRRMGAIAAVVALWAGPVAAQENLEKGKTPAQLYASDCAICHKTPRGLAKGGGAYGLENFLRAHYTSSRESAAAIGAYLRSVDKGGPAKDEPASKRKTGSAKPGAGEAAPKASAAKPDTKKSGGKSD